MTSSYPGVLDFVTGPSKTAATAWLQTSLGVRYSKGKWFYSSIEALAGLSVSVDAHPVLHQVSTLME